MFWNRYFTPSFLVLVIVAILHWIASDLGYYWTVEWYDFMMHFLGGAWVALFVLWASETSYGHRLKPLITGKNLIVFTFLFGIAWEIFELVMGFTDVTMKGYTWDTTHDLIMDVVGVSVVVLFSRKFFKRPVPTES